MNEVSIKDDGSIKKVAQFNDLTLVKETIYALLERKKYEQLLTYLSTCLLFLDDELLRNDYCQQTLIKQDADIHTIIASLDNKNTVFYSLNLLTDFILNLVENGSDEKLVCHVLCDKRGIRSYIVEYSSNKEHNLEYDNLSKTIIQTYENAYLDCGSFNHYNNTPFVDAYLLDIKHQKYIYIPTELATIEEYSKINMLIAGIDIKHSYVQAPTLTAQGEESITI